MRHITKMVPFKDGFLVVDSSLDVPTFVRNTEDLETVFKRESQPSVVSRANIKIIDNAYVVYFTNVDVFFSVDGFIWESRSKWIHEFPVKVILNCGGGTLYAFCAMTLRQMTLGYSPKMNEIVVSHDNGFTWNAVEKLSKKIDGMLTVYHNTTRRIPMNDCDRIWKRVVKAGSDLAQRHVYNLTPLSAPKDDYDYYTFKSKGQLILVNSKSGNVKKN